MYIQEIKDWNKGQKITAPSYPAGWYMYFDPEQFLWFARDERSGEEKNYDIDEIDWMDDSWEAFELCPHCNGTGRRRQEPTDAKPKSKGRAK